MDANVGSTTTTQVCGGRAALGRAARMIAWAARLAGLCVCVGIGIGVGACGGGGGGERAGDASSLPPGVSTAAVSPPVSFDYDSLDDRPVSADATRDKPTVMAFITTGSLKSQAQVDFLVAMAEHDADRTNYAVVSLDPTQNRELVEIYRKALHVTFPVAMADDVTRAGAGPFGDVTAVPVTVVLDRAGRIAGRVEKRVARSEELRAMLRGL